MDLDRFLQMGVPQRLKQLSYRRKTEALGELQFLVSSMQQETPRGGRDLGVREEV